MATKEKWVELFEKVAERKPTPSEFMAGKATDFDLKQIKSIAGLSEESAPLEQVPVSSLAQEEGAFEVADVVPSQPQPVADPEPVEEVTATVSEQPVIEPAVALVRDEVTPFVEAVEPLEEPTETVVTPSQTATDAPRVELIDSPTPRPIKPALTKQQKIKRAMMGLGAVLVLGLGAGYYVLDQQTGPEVAVADFSEALGSNDYDRLAQLLSTDKEEWTKEEAKGFLEYLASNDIDFEAELNKLATAAAGTTYNDDRGNKLFSLTETSKRFGIFPEYQVTTYPIELTAKTNLTDLKIEETAVPKDKDVSLGEVKFAPKDLAVTGKTDLGDLKTSISLNLQEVENNSLKLTMETTTKKVTAKLATELAGMTNVKLFVNGKQVADGLSKEVPLLDNQKVEVAASFTYEGTDYKTETQSLVASPGQALEATLSLSSENEKRIEEAKKAKEAKDAAAKAAAEAEQEKARQLAATKDRAYNFITAYRRDVYDSIRYHDNRFASYYDTSTDVYQSMVDYTVGRGSLSKGVSYLVAGDYSLLDFTQVDGSTYRLTVHNTFNQILTGGGSKFVDKNQTFTLRAEGNTFKIIGEAETFN